MTPTSGSTLAIPTTAIVLAGGASRRMGTDKRSISIDGSPMLIRVLDGLSEVGRILVVIDPSRPLPLVLPLDERIDLIADLRPGEGPLAGLEAGLTAARDDTVLILAADMPWLEPTILRMLVTRLASAPSADLACLTVDGRRQPFPVACRRLPALRHITSLLDAGERRLRALLDDAAVETIAESEWRVADPEGRSIRDVDKPADLAPAP